MRTYNNRDLFSRRIGCQLYNAPQFGGVNFLSLCVRPAVTTDDAVISEPGSGTTVVARSRAPEQRDGQHGHDRLRDRRTARPMQATTTRRRPER